MEALTYTTGCNSQMWPGFTKPNAKKRKKPPTPSQIGGFLKSPETSPPDLRKLAATPNGPPS